MAAKKTAKPKASKDLPGALDALTRAVLINADFVHPWKRMLMAFGRGMAYGLGLLAAVAVVVPIVLALIKTVDWVPVFGDFFAEVGKRIEEAQGNSK